MVMDARSPHRATFQLPEWACRRESGRRLVVEGWVGLAGLAIVIALLDDSYLVLPAVDAVVTGAVVLGFVVRTRWWRWRRRLAGHPMARAALVRSIARGQLQPEGWPETLVMGAVHVTANGWRWAPSVFCTDDVDAHAWRHDQVCGLRYTPSWGPGLPRAGYVRLLLDGDAPVDLLVWDPDVLGLLAPLPEEVGGRIAA